MSSLESQLRSVLTDEARRAPEAAGLAGRVRAQAARGHRQHQVRIVGAVVAAAAVVTGFAVLPPLLRGPAATPGLASSPTAGGGAQAAWATLLAECDSQQYRPADAGHLPADLGPVTAAYTCWTGIHEVPGDGAWSFREVRRVTGGLATTLKAYAVPDGSTGSGHCAFVSYVRHVIVLDIGGKVIAVREPTTTCSAPLQSAVAAYEAMTTEVVSSVRLSQVESPLSMATGCSNTVKDTVALLPQMQGLPATARPATLPAADSVTACVYTSGPDLDGTLSAATRLTPAEYGQVRDYVARATADPTCATTAHTRFVVLAGVGLPWTEIVLDGCGLDQGSGALRAPKGLADLLLSALKHQVIVS